MKVYISGPITGMADLNRPAFHAATERLRGWCEPVNPMEHTPYNTEWTWEDYMRDDLNLLLKCDAIYMLNGWRGSRGATIEHDLAMNLGMVIMREGEEGVEI